MSLYNKLARKYAVMPVLMRSESGVSETLPAGSTASLPSVVQASLTAPTGQFIQQDPLDGGQSFAPTTPITPTPTFTSSTPAVQRAESTTPFSAPTMGQPVVIPATATVQRAVQPSTTSTASVQRSSTVTPQIVPPVSPTLTSPTTSVQRSETQVPPPSVPTSESTDTPSDDDRLSYILRKHQERIDSGQPIEKAEKTVSAPWLADALQKHERKIATKQLQRSTLLTGEVGIARQEALQRAKERPRPSITYVSNNPGSTPSPNPSAPTTPNISRSSLKESAPSVSRQMSREVADLTSQSVAGSQTPSTISRQAIDNPPLPIQRQEEEDTIALKPEVSQVQRQGDVAPEEEEIQTKRVSQVQRQGDVAPEEEEIQTKRVNQVQRQGDVAPEEEEIQTKRVSQVQRQGDVAPEEEEIARKIQPSSANATWGLPTSNTPVADLPTSSVQRASVASSAPAPSVSVSTPTSMVEQSSSVSASLPAVEQSQVVTTSSEPEQTTPAAAPFLGDGWKVQRVEDTAMADGGEPILELPSASQPIVDSSPAAHADVQRALSQVSPAKSTDAHVELVLPRRARPGTVAQRSVQPNPPPVSPSQPADSYMVSTDIGELPSDLWTTLGEKPPEPQRKTDDSSRPIPAVDTSSPLIARQISELSTSSTSASVVQRTESNLIQESAPAIDNELSLDLESPTATQKQEEVKENEAGETDQQSELFEVELARRVYQDIKRRLVVEKERSRGRF